MRVLKILLRFRYKKFPGYHHENAENERFYFRQTFPVPNKKGGFK